MGLELNQIREAIQKPNKQKEINRAIAHQNRIKFHAQTKITSNLSQPLTDFIVWVESLIPHDKAKIFKQLFRYPVKTNEVTDIVFYKLSRIFDGRNPAFNYQFYNTEQRDDWEYYRQDVLNEPNIWSSRGWEFFKTDFNSVLIVDLPKEQDATDKYPQPYFYWLPIEQVINYSVNEKSGNMDWIIFRQPDNKIAVFDDERYRVYEVGRDNNIGSVIVDNPHDLGYCPARFFWNQSISLAEPDIKLHPITKTLSGLDWYLFFHISKHHLDLYGSYPIYSGYKQNCDYSNQESGDVCDGGFLRDKNNYYKLDNSGALFACPKCGDKRIAGVGSFVEVPIPNETEGIPDLRNPVQVLTIDRDSLDYNVDEETRLKNDLITAAVGIDSNLVNDQAINEKQVNANFESASTILNRIKKGFEEAQNFVDSTVCRLRYGKMFISAKINLGTEFYLTTASELRQQYKIAKDSGASETELSALQNQIIETEYRNNPTQLQRMLILSDLEPFWNFTRAEILDLYSKQLINGDSLLIKLNFSNFVKRFERENTNILEFGTQIPYEKKIQIINQKFKEYVNENRPRPSDIGGN